MAERAKQGVGVLAGAMVVAAVAAAAWLAAARPGGEGGRGDGAAGGAGGLHPPIVAVRADHPMIPLMTLDAPRFVDGEEAWSFLEPEDPVLGLVVGGEARAYPRRILDWHETVNDRVGGTPLLVSWCNVCGTGLVFDRRVDDRELRFRSPGLFWRDNGLLQDDVSGTLWLQATGEGLQGPRRGRRLAVLPFRSLLWRAWVREYPDTLVLSDRQGLLPRRAYREGPARGDEFLGPSVAERMGNVGGDDPELAERVLGLRVGGAARAYRLADLQRTTGPFRDRAGEVDLLLQWDRAAGSLSVRTAAGEALQVYPSSLGAWLRFQESATVWTPNPGTGN